MAPLSAPFSLLILCTLLLQTLGSCHSFRPPATGETHEFPVLRLERRVTGEAASNGTSFNNSSTKSWACEFTPDYLVEAAKANCSAYIDPLESTTALLPWERYESIKGFANCTYHQIAVRFPDIPDGIPALVFRDGRLVFTPRPNMVNARGFGPPPPVDSLSDLPGKTTVPFLPILEDATEPYFRSVTELYPGACAPANSSVVATTEGTGDVSYMVGYLLQSIEITTQQYTRCALQQPPSSVPTCTTSSVSKLGALPSALFIYFGAPQCDSKLWSFLGVALSILLDALHLAALMYLRGDHFTATHSFSWLQFLVKLASGVGEPAIQAALLHRVNNDDGSGTSTGFVIAAMEFLQPTAAPIVAFVAGWWFSKGHGFQVLATDAVTTLLGLVMVCGFTTMQIAIAVVTDEMGGGSLIVPVGLLCAVGPWLLTYLLFGLVGLPMQIGFIVGLFELCLGLEKSYGFQVFGFCLGVLLVVLGFVAATPLFAIWEAIWVALRWNNKRKAGKEEEASERAEEKTLFPLARWFRRRFQDTSRFKRGLVKFLFWTFVLLSLASFVGKWMFMVTVLNFAGDAYCPSGYKEATFGGLGFKAGVLSIGVAIQYFGLTA